MNRINEMLILACISLLLMFVLTQGWIDFVYGTSFHLRNLTSPAEFERRQKEKVLHGLWRVFKSGKPAIPYNNENLQLLFGEALKNHGFKEGDVPLPLIYMRPFKDALVLLTPQYPVIIIGDINDWDYWLKKCLDEYFEVMVSGKVDNWRTEHPGEVMREGE